MAKNALILSPFFCSLLLLVSIAFISEQGGGVSGQSNYCKTGTGSPFGYRVQPSVCSGCDSFCQSLALPAGRPPGVQSGTCFQVPSSGPISQYVCLCCVR